MSFHHQFILGNFIKDVLPDYLTCGYCASEFLLDNITMFIAHKISGCYKTSAIRSSNPPPFEDTAGPLTCSSCSRMFMTARGLLLHVQEDHQMNLCLQKGSLRSVGRIRPPPAHSAVSGSDFTTTDKPNRYFSLLETRSASSGDHSEEPTDLSMAFSNSSAKLLLKCKCSEGNCEKMIQPNSTVIYDENSELIPGQPKKRRVLLSEDSENDARFSGGTLGAANVAEDDETKNFRSDNLFRTEDSSEKIGTDSDLFLSVKVENSTDAQFTLSNTDKKEHERHAKLRRLLQKNSTPEPEEKDVKTQANFSPSHLESSTIMMAAYGAQETCVDFENEEFSTVGSETEIRGKMSKSDISTFFQRSALRQNIDSLIRASLAPVVYPKEQEVLSLRSSSTDSSSKKTKVSGSNLFTTSLVSCPHLLVHGEKTKQSCSSTSSVDVAIGDINNRSEIIFNNSQPKKQSSGETSNRRESDEHPASFSYVVESKSETAGVVKRSVDHPKISLDPINEPVPKLCFSETASSDVYHDGSFPEQDNNEIRFDNPCDLSRFSTGGSFLTVYRRQDILSTSEVQDRQAEQRTFGLEESTYRRPTSRTWMSFQDEESVDFPGAGSNPRPSLRSATQNVDLSVHEDLDPVCAGSENFPGIDLKVLKRRRYPTSRPFKCAHCEQAFNQRIHLKKHMSKHTGVKPFKCQQCDYSTVERSHLKVHYRIHTGEKPYRCLYCDYATAQNSTLKIHLKRHHEGQTTSESSRMRASFHLSGSLDDDEWSLHDKHFPNFQSERTRKHLHSTSVQKDHPRLNKEKGKGSMISISSHQQEPQMLATSFNELHFKVPELASELPSVHMVSEHDLQNSASNTGKSVMKNTVGKGKSSSKNQLPAAAYEYLPTIPTDRQFPHRSGKGTTTNSSKSTRDRNRIITTPDMKLSPTEDFVTYKGDKLRHSNEEFNSSLSAITVDVPQKSDDTILELTALSKPNLLKQKPQMSTFLSSTSLGATAGVDDHLTHIIGDEGRQLHSAEKCEKLQENVTDSAHEQTEKNTSQVSELNRIVLINQPGIDTEDLGIDRVAAVAVVTIPEKDFVRG